FQAEDGIRDFHVTGVQTCALPISIVGITGDTSVAAKRSDSAIVASDVSSDARSFGSSDFASFHGARVSAYRFTARMNRNVRSREIGRASCRERVWMWRVCVALERR